MYPKNWFCQLFTHSWRENIWIHTFARGVSTMFKPVKLRLKNDLVSYPAREEGLVNMIATCFRLYWIELMPEKIRFVIFQPFSGVWCILECSWIFFFSLKHVTFRTCVCSRYLSTDLCAELLILKRNRLIWRGLPFFKSRLWNPKFITCFYFVNGFYKLSISKLGRLIWFFELNLWADPFDFLSTTLT